MGKCITSEYCPRDRAVQQLEEYLRSKEDIGIFASLEVVFIPGRWTIALRSQISKKIWNTVLLPEVQRLVPNCMVNTKSYACANYYSKIVLSGEPMVSEMGTYESCY